MNNKVRVLITGATGLLGTALKVTVPANVELVDERADITKPREINALFQRSQPNVVIHAASMGNVDDCERNKAAARAVNVLGTKHIVEACKRCKAKIVFLSSNAIFDGQNPPYNERSAPKPVNYYGKTKLLGENIVKRSKLKYLIVRLTLMYGWNRDGQRNNAVTWLLDKLKKHESVKLVDDTYVNPAYNIQAAEVIWGLLRKNKTGIYHFAGKDRINRYQFGVLTARVFGFNQKLISPVTSDYFPNIARRMPDTTFSTKKIKKALGVKPFSLEAGLKKMKKEKNEHRKRQ